MHKRISLEETQQSALERIFNQINSEDTFSKRIGMNLVELQSGFARATLSVTDAMVNIYKMAHGGVIFSLADLACEAAGNSLGEPAVALQLNIHFLAPGKSDDLLEATARVTKRSTRIGLIEFEVKNQEGNLLAKGEQVFYFKKGNK